MSHSASTTAAPQTGAITAPGRRWGKATGLSALLMPGVLGAFSLYLLIGSFAMDTEGMDFPGPSFFPLILGFTGLAVALALAVQVVLHRDEPEVPEGQADADGEVGQSAGPLRRFQSDFTALAWAFFGFLAFAVLLPWLGWILAGALLFWCVTRAFGSPRPVFDILVSLFMSSVAYLAFAVMLGLTLPSGILGGGF
ncbi:MAG: tripartite tricarboxylate transporter TctB family protein [Micrococcus sp.]|nr:tripartite tricarboxylate transporter TctB family protein [Micrococcus sp.]